MSTPDGDSPFRPAPALPTKAPSPRPPRNWDVSWALAGVMAWVLVAPPIIAFHPTGPRSLPLAVAAAWLGVAVGAVALALGGSRRRDASVRLLLLCAFFAVGETYVAYFEWHPIYICTKPRNRC